MKNIGYLCNTLKADYVPTIETEIRKQLGNKMEYYINELITNVIKTSCYVMKYITFS